MTTASDDPRAIGRNPGAARGNHSRRRWIKRVIVAVAVAVLVIVVGTYVLLSMAVADVGRGISNGFATGFEKVLSGGTAANDAAALAAFRQEPPGTLSISTLNAALPKYRWIDGGTSVPYSTSKRRIVGVEVSGSHIETAVQADPGSCSFGLAVTSGSDPLLAAEHLSGPGTYWTTASPSTSGCVADQAPTTSWATWDQGLADGS